MNSFWKSILSAVVGGIIVWVVTFALEPPLSPKSQLYWGISKARIAPEEITGSEETIYSYDLIFENAGNAVGKDIEFYFLSMPKFARAPQGLVSEWEQDGNYSILRIDALPPGASISIEVYSSDSGGPVAARSGGDPVDSVDLKPAELDLQFRTIRIMNAFALLVGAVGFGFALFPIFRVRKDIGEQEQKIERLKSEAESSQTRLQASLEEVVSTLRKQDSGK